MTRAQRMKRIVGLADLTERVASQRLVSSRSKHDGNLAKLAEFRRYLDEYNQAFRESSASVTAASLREMRNFVAQLELTIGALEAHARRSGLETANELEAWKRESRRANALAEVLDRNVRAADQQTERSLQREIDDRGRKVDDA